MSVSFKPVSRLTDCLDLASPPISKKTNTRMAALGVDPVRVKENCGVCLNPIDSDERVKQLYCKHKFHQECIDSWLVNKPLCPHCRDNVEINAPHLLPFTPVGSRLSVCEIQVIGYNRHMGCISTPGELLGILGSGLGSMLTGSVANGCQMGDDFGSKAAIASATLLGMVGTLGFAAKINSTFNLKSYSVTVTALGLLGIAITGVADRAITGESALQSAAIGAAYGVMHLTSLKVGKFVGKYAQFIADM